MKHIIKSILLLTILNAFLASAQSKYVTRPTISGSINYHKKDRPDSILIMTYPKYNYWDTSVDYTVKINNMGQFHFQFPTMYQPIVYSLVTVKNNIVNDLGEFYAEPGDQIHLDIFHQQIKSGFTQKDSIVFSGKGSAKYILIEELNKIFARSYASVESLSPPKSLKDSTMIYLNFFDQVAINYKKETSKLVWSANGIDLKMKNLLMNEFAQNNINLIWAATHKLMYDLCNSNQLIQNRIRENFNRKYNLLVNDTPDETSLLCPRYYQSTNAIIKYKLMLNRNGYVDLKEQYETLKNLFSGKFSEKMLSELFKGAYGMSDLSNINSVYDSLIIDAEKYLTSEDGHNIINEKLKLKKGAKLFDADFIDLEGNKFDFSFLKGKVFLLETWGLGCSVCAGFHKKFEQELWPILKTYKDFIVLSIYDGKTKKNWLKGINSQLYTSKKYLNISNLPYGNINHPFFKYYNVNYAPFMLLANKEGRVIASFRPNNIKLKELLSLIDLSLAQPEFTK